MAAYLPILNTLVPQVGQTPWVAGLLFFMTILLGFLISFLARHLGQHIAKSDVPYRFVHIKDVVGADRVVASRVVLDPSHLPAWTDPVK